MIQSPSTLHDFVLNLLSDPSLKAAFAADAQGTLEQAGLADITAVDVQEVIPLVIDLLPATPAGLPAVEGVYFDGVLEDVLAEGPLGAISQLQAVASQLTTSGVSLTDIGSSSAGLLAADEHGLTVWAGTNTADTYGAGAVKLDGDFSAVGDVASVLDQTTSPVTGTALDVADTATSTVDSTLATATGVVPGADGLLGQLTGVTGLADGLLGTVGGGDANLGALNVTGLGSVADGNLGIKTDDTLGQLQHTAGGVVDTATGVTGHATGLTGDVAGVGNVLGTVTDVAGDVPVVGDLDLGGLLG
ncbi:IniB N-terminal domain-containing protein [Lentzea sp. NPDC051213]|uniref:IniB N-terminal domain-containing protein n=1 Tax=Lentzea sp. NPDC051213 TaxID=3364126 RepID=UPI00379C7897